MVGDLILRSGIVGASDLVVTQRGAGANMSVDIAGGDAYIKGTSNAQQGTYHVVSDSTVVNKTIAAAHATLSRTDLVIAEVLDQQYSGVSNLWQLRVVTGTAGSGAPAVPVNSLLLASVTVPAAAASIINSNITDNRVRFGSLGVPVQVLNAADRDSIGAFDSLMVYRHDTDTVEMRANGTWQQVVVGDTGWQNMTLQTGWTAVAGRTPQVRMIGGVCHSRGAVTRGSGAGANVAQVPAAFYPSAAEYLGMHLTSAATPTNNEIDLSTGGMMSLGFQDGGVVVGANLPLSFTWMAG